MMVGAFSLENMVSSAGGLATQLTGVMGANQTQQAIAGLNGDKAAESPTTPAGAENQSASDPAKIIQDYQAELEKMTPEEREFFKNSSPGMQTLTNPVVQKLVGVGPAKKGTGAASSTGVDGVAAMAMRLAAAGSRKTPPSSMKIWAGKIYLKYYPRFKNDVFTGSWVVPLSLLGLSAFCMVLQYGGASSFLCNIVLEGTGFALAAFSILCVYVGFYFGGAASLSMMLELLPSPIVFLVLAAGLMRLLDMNFPVMSQVLGSLVLPAVCVVLSGGLSMLSGGLPKII